MRLIQVILIALRLQLRSEFLMVVLLEYPPLACHSPGVSPLETTFPSLLWPERVPVGFKIRLPIEVYGGSPVCEHLRKLAFANGKFYVRDITTNCLVYGVFNKNMVTFNCLCVISLSRL